MKYSLNGTWNVTLPNNRTYPLTLPGTLDESNIGFPDVASGQIHPDEAPNEALQNNSSAILTRFTRKHTYVGNARIFKTIRLPLELFSKEHPRIFLKAERARCLSLLVNDTPVPAYQPASLSTPYLFELTSVLKAGNAPSAPVCFAFDSDNSYPGLPADAITYSSAATDETQTNWNGILGDFYLYTKESTFLSDLRVYPVQDALTGAVTVTVTLTLDVVGPDTINEHNEAFRGIISLSSPALAAPIHREVSLSAGIHEITLEQLPLADTVSYWEEEEGNLYDLTATLSNGSTIQTTFGIRFFSTENGQFTLNGRRIFLRSEANCAVFPETGHPPMTLTEWEKILRRYRAYGVNHLRFHSHCPPESAFAAADRLGILIQAELSHWDPKHALESEESFLYYKKELLCLLHKLANHPSFVMMALGNELHADEVGHARMRELVQLAKETDHSRLYADGSNTEYGTQGCDSYNDFYTTQMHLTFPLRATFACQDKEKRRLEGYLNNQYPNACTNYDSSMQKVRDSYSGPLYTFEVGQYEILPDFDELDTFHGISRPDNLTRIMENVEQAGMLSNWKRYVEATGELSLLCYREEIEAALRTKDLSGISLLGLQDFPGQGTALVGMLNSHLNSKPFDFANPERFREFFTGQLPLVLLPKYTYTSKEILIAEVIMANYGKQAITGTATYTLTTEEGNELFSGTFPEVSCTCGSLTPLGTLNLPLTSIAAPSKITLRIQLGSCKNSYPIWIYPDITPVCPASVYETKQLDNPAKEVLSEGGTVYLSPNSTKEQLPHSIQGQFSTDFWSVGTFPAQEGGMGLFIDETHPVFSEFPTEFHTNWQWWPMANQRAVILPKHYDSIITQLDSYAYLRPMTMLLECRCGNGRLLLSTMGLQNLQEYPEAQALLHSIYCYLASDSFSPTQELSLEELNELVL